MTRVAGTLLLAITVAFLVLAVLPFYGNGIHLHSYQEIGGSQVDVKGYPPFTWLGGPAQGVAMLSTGLLPLAALVLNPVLVAGLWLGRGRLSRAEGLLWLATIVSNITLVALTWHTRAILLTWLVD